MMGGLEFWMKTLTTKKLISVTVANAGTRLFENDKRESGMEVLGRGILRSSSSCFRYLDPYSNGSKRTGEGKHSAGIPHPP